MASAVREWNYQRYNHGDLAYSLDREVLEHNLRHAGELRRPRETAVEKPKVRSVSKVQVRERQKVSIVSVVGFGAVIALAVLVLMSYIQLTALSADVVSLKSELAELETENVLLTAQHEQMFDLATVKEAAEAANMAKPSSSQIYYIDLSGSDAAVVYQQSDPGLLSEILTSLNHGIYAVVEYFD